MASIELAVPFPSCSFFNHNQIHNHMPFHRHIHFHVDANANLTRHATSTPTIATTEQSNTLHREVFLNDSYTDTYVTLLQACTNIKQLQQLHAHMLTTGLDQNIYLITKFVNMYSVCGSMEDARLLFDKTCNPNVFLWTAMISGYVRNGFCEEALMLYYLMRSGETAPDKFIFTSVIKACGSLSALTEGVEIHNDTIRAGFESDMYVDTSLVDMYSKCGRVEIARNLFDKMSQRNAVSWGAMITGYVQNGYAGEALTLFNEMLLRDIKPDVVTIASILPACAYLSALPQGKWVHSYVIRNGFESHVVVLTALIDMYAKCGNIYYACHLFDKMPKRNVVSWNAMLAGYAHNGHASEALTLVSEMRLQDIKPNLVTAVSVLPACSHLSALQQGKQLHGYTIRNELESDVVLGNALIDMYAKCGRMDFARRLFEKMYKRNVVSWNTIIAGSSQNGQPNEALKFFNAMKLQGMKPNSVTMVSVLPAFAALPERQGKWIHGYIIKNGFGLDVVVDNALLDMYAKGRKIEIAREVFDRMSKRNVVSWSAMIAGYAQNGHGSEALAVFNEMQLQGIKPDSVTVMSILSACTRFLDLEQGKRFHGYIIRVGFDSDVVVGNALIDMYAKCGSIEVARHLFDNMSEKNLVSWNAMVSGYGMHGHGEDALALFAQMQKKGMKPDDITFISVLSACSHAGLVDEGWQYFDCMSRDYHIIPRVEHYACMVDLLGRSGLLDEAHDFIKKMPLEPNAVVWGTLLGACRIHSNIELGEHVAERLFELEPENAACYILLSNIYAEAGRWDDVAKLRNTMKVRGLKKTPGCSWIVLGNRVHAFHAGD
eukprot:Gb_08834 [translate_table: standard]